MQSIAKTLSNLFLYKNTYSRYGSLWTQKEDIAYELMNIKQKKKTTIATELANTQSNILKLIQHAHNNIYIIARPRIACSALIL